jgi:transposase
MRRSFDGLGQIAEAVVGEDPMSGHLFVFRNRRRDRVKVLHWDRSGFVLWYKRLEEGSFQFPSNDGARLEVSSADLAMILEGIDLSEVRRRKRFHRKVVFA